jgi:hypothetical protein
MAIERWTPNPTLSPKEEKLLSRHKYKRKLFTFLRLHRDELFDQEFQQELESMYRDTEAGKEPHAPALMAMAMLLQGYEKLSDADAVEHTASDMRWRMVLDRMEQDEPAFSQGALVNFRWRMIKTDMDRRLLERTVQLSRKTKGFDPNKLPKTLRVAIDSAPLEGAGRVEDTINLLWHAARKIVEGMALMLQSDKETICRQAGIPLLLGSSAKAALDGDWSEPEHRAQALDQLVDELEALVIWLSLHHGGQMQDPLVKGYVQTLQQVIHQDLEPAPEPQNEGLQIREGVAKDRQISVEDPQMRHGRKSKSQLIDGYKRHILEDLDTKLILACAITPANRPEAEATPSLEQDLEAQGLNKVDELQVDQAYVNSSLAQKVREQQGRVICRPRVTNNGELFRKEDFELDLVGMTIRCPAGQVQPIQLGKKVTFDGDTCQGCGSRAQCTDAVAGRGRTVSIARDEREQQELRQRIKTKEGRAELRQRVDIEHGLAHVTYRQGDQARYIGVRKNLFDLRRASTITNLETIHRVIQRAEQVVPLRAAA